MAKNKTFTIENTNIQILAPLKELDFFDRQSISLGKKISPLKAWEIVMSQPMPVLKLAFKLRDSISSMFAVKKIGGFSGVMPKKVQVGQKFDFFLVEHLSQDVLTLTARDKHLDVMTCVSTCNDELTITSSVKTHNTFGRFYMIPVAPIHKLIVRKNLKQIQQHLMI